jgi:molybdopterin-binding protein
MTNIFPVASSFAGDGGVHIRLGTDKVDGPRGDLELVAASRTEESSGEATLAVIRSEEIVLLSAGDVPAVGTPEGRSPSQNLLEGVVKDVQLQSVHACVEVEVPPVFSVHVLRPDVERIHLEVGSRVQLWIPPEAVHICAASNDGPPHRGTD